MDVQVDNMNMIGPQNTQNKEHPSANLTLNTMPISLPALPNPIRDLEKKEYK